MDDYESLSHSKWECKYHVVFIPKYRRKTLYAELRRHLGEVFRKLAEQKESRIEEGHLLLDHVHMLISIPPKYAVSQVIGFIKGALIELSSPYTRAKCIALFFVAAGFREGLPIAVLRGRTLSKARRPSVVLPQPAHSIVYDRPVVAGSLLRDWGQRDPARLDHPLRQYRPA